MAAGSLLVLLWASQGTVSSANVGLSAGPPLCLEAVRDTMQAYRLEELAIESEGVTLAGRLFLPRTPGPHPAVVLMHGGGQQRLNEAPLFFAPFLARCGVAALVYDKRGTGASGGVWEASVFDDFVVDAAAAVAALAGRDDIDAQQVGLIGFSQGGRLAPVVSTRFGQVAFIVSVSGPFASLAETRLYALEQRLRRWGLSGSALDSTMTLWKQHFTLLVDEDAGALATMDDAVRVVARRYGAAMLPPTSDRLPVTPLYNSMTRDYAADLHRLRVPLLAIYGERDAVVPVQPSVAVLEQALERGGHRDLTVQIIPFADHSFVDWTFNQRIKVEEIVIGWILERIARPSSAAPKVNASQKR